MDEENNITRRRALLAGGTTLTFGAGVAYVATRPGSCSEGYVPATLHAGEGTSGFGVDLTGRPIVGEPDAPVEIYYWTDYLCPFCKQFETETLPDLSRDYIDAGTVRLPVLAYPNIGAYSTPAGVWSRCVWEQVADSNPEAFWHWHEEAFATQPESKTAWADEATFEEITRRTDGVDLESIQECRATDSERLREELATDQETARSLGIQGTPGFVIYDRESGTAGKLVGAHPYETFEEAIENVRNA